MASLAINLSLLILSGTFAIYNPDLNRAYGINVLDGVPGVPFDQQSALTATTSGISSGVPFDQQSALTATTSGISSASNVGARVVTNPDQCGEDGSVTVTKELDDPRSLLDDGSSVEFTVTVITGGVPESEPFVLREGSAGVIRTFCVTPGASFNVVETSRDVDFRGIETGICEVDGPAQDINYACHVTNEITSIGGDGIRDFSGDALGDLQGDEPSSHEGVTTETAITTTGTQGPLASQVSSEGRLTNPPFDSCEDNTVGDDANKIIRTPSSATYIISGKVSLDKVQEALESLRTKSITIQLLSDLESLDMVSLSVASPQFVGKILVEGTDENGNKLKQKIINYNILDLRTECKYITIAEAAGPSTYANVAPLGQLGETNSLQPSKVDEILLGGRTVSSSPTKAGPLPAVLNSPFATCDTTDANQRDNFAIYNLRGEVKDVSVVDGNNLIVEITTDLLITESDLARIVNNNNPYMKAELLSEHNRRTYDRIGFTLNDVWTDCKNLAVTTDPVFEPIAGETNY
jgi:hypothetical protein